MRNIVGRLGKKEKCLVVHFTGMHTQQINCVFVLFFLFVSRVGLGQKEKQNAANLNRMRIVTKNSYSPFYFFIFLSTEHEASLL